MFQVSSFFRYWYFYKTRLRCSIFYGFKYNDDIAVLYINSTRTDRSSELTESLVSFSFADYYSYSIITVSEQWFNIRI